MRSRGDAPIGRAWKLASACAGVLMALTSLAAPAGAHVEASASEPDATGIINVDLSFEHGCDGAATTGLRVKTPDQAHDVAPRDKPGWTSSFSDGVVEWTGGSITNDTPTTFTIALALDAPTGTTVYFPTIQICGTQENAWIAIPAPQDPDPKNPAPSIVAPGPRISGSDSGSDLDGAPTTAMAEQSTATASISESTASTLTGTAVTVTSKANSGSDDGAKPLLIGAVVLVVIVAAAVIVRSTRRRR